MKVEKTKLDGVLVLQPQIFEDERGFFLESFNKFDYKEVGINFDFVQDNHSHSSKGVLRGLHFQRTRPQGKLVRVVKGEVFDVAVDLRKDSSTFGQWEAIILTEKNKTQFWVPPGFAHGFLVLSESADFEYKCTDYYNPHDELSLLWSDPDLDIPWPITNPKLSKKDAKAKKLTDLNL